MAKHNGGKSSLVITLAPVAPATEGVPVNMCVLSIDSIDLPKGWVPSHTTCDFDEDLEITFTKREQTTATLRFSVTAFSEDQLTLAQEEELFFTSKEIGPVILTRHGTKGFYLPLATAEISYRPGGIDGLQTFSITGESQGIFHWGIVEPTP